MTAAAAGATLGTVAELRRYPVKSMLGESVERIGIRGTGVIGDRQYALIDGETGKIVSVKRPKRWGRIFELRAWTDGARVRVSFPDGTSYGIDDPELPARLSAFFGRAVSVTSAVPAGAQYDELWVRELKDGADPYGGMPTDIADGEELINGGAFMSPDRPFFDFGTVHLVTTGSVDQLAAHTPGTRFDPLRFRPNVVVRTAGSPLDETQLRGRTLAVGDVRLTVGIPVPRCVMTTLAQEDLPADREVLRTITRHNAVDIGLGVPYPCLGVYADVALEGEVAVGDDVSVA